MDRGGARPVTHGREWAEGRAPGVAERLLEQATGCRSGGSPLSAMLLERCAADVEAGGPVHDVLLGTEREPAGSALALRFLAAVHRLVLSGIAPALAERYPSAGGAYDPGRDDDATWATFLSTVAANVDRLRREILRPCQTNEVGRSAALLGGFLWVVRLTRMPLRLLEIGASAGLNLRWDRYRYEGSGVAWGDERSPVRLRGMFGEPPPELDPPVDGVSVAERAGCDLHPIDPRDPEDRLTLEASVWADDVERLGTLRAAIELASGGAAPVTMDRASAPDWLEDRLASDATGMATVVFHSVVLQYLTAAERARVGTALERAGGAASRGAPLAWLRMESPDWRRSRPHEVRLTTWPGGRDRLLARPGPHGRPVRWLA